LLPNVKISTGIKRPKALIMPFVTHNVIVYYGFILGNRGKIDYALSKLTFDL
jgi:hypothetical protein